MNNYTIYRLGVDFADELMMTLGVMPEKTEQLYMDLVMFGFFVCAKASNVFSGNKFTEDAFVSTLIMYRDDFCDKNVAELSEIAKTAYAQYQKFMCYWPAYKDELFFIAVRDCVLNALDICTDNSVDSIKKRRFDNKLQANLSAIENIFLSRESFVAEEDNFQQAFLIKSDKEQLGRRKKIEFESKVVRKVFPVVFLVSALLGGLLSVLFHRLVGS